MQPKLGISEIKRLRRSTTERIRNNPELLLSNLGFVDVMYNGVFFSAACAVHGGDNTTAFCLYADSLIWNCHTHDCASKLGHGIFDLIMLMKDVGLKDAIIYASNLYGVNGNNMESIEEKIQKEKISSRARDNKIFDPAVLDRLVPNNYFLKRGFSEETTKTFQCGFATTGQLNNRMIVPIHNPSGGIVGFSGRTIFNHCEKCGRFHNGNQCRSIYTKIKWKNSKGMIKSNILFNLHRARKYIEANKEVVLVEGPIDTMRLWQIGVRTCVAALGTKLHVKQIKLLLSLGQIKTVYILSDNDDGISRLYDNNVELISKYFDVIHLKIRGKKDIGEMTDQRASKFIRVTNVKMEDITCAI